MRTGRSRGAAAIMVMVMAAGLATGVARAEEPTPTGDIVEACVATVGQEAQIGGRLCRSQEQSHRVEGQACRYLGPEATDEACSTIDGRRYSAAAMDEFRSSWVARALSLQGALDDGVPLTEALVPGTHNSFNSAAYAPTLSGLDHNQVATLGDQLDMGMRGIELDVHWFPSPTADPGDAGMAPILCHGEPVPGGSSPSIHVGCTAERHLRDGLAELRDWLSGHPDEVILLYLENNLDGVPAAHDAVARTLDDELGDLVARPATNCEAMPYGASEDDIRTRNDGDARILIVGNCGPGGWGSWVHVRGPEWHERSSAPGDSEACSPGTDGDGFNRIYEDSTWLSAMIDANPAQTQGLTDADVRALVACGVNLLGFDQLVPGDSRLETLVWSWAPNQPSVGTVAYQGADGRFRSDAGLTGRPYACRHADGTWEVTTAGGPWSGGGDACAAIGADFDVPRTGADAARLLAARPQGSSVWVAYAELADHGWTPGAQRMATSCDSDAQTAPGVTADAVRVRGQVVASGIGATMLREARVGIEAAVRQANAAGGIHGRRIDLSVIDDGWDPARGAALVENAIAEGCTFGLLVNPSTEGLRAAIDSGVISEHGFPVVGALGELSSSFTEPWVWPVGPSEATAARIAVKHARNRGAQSFAVVYEGNYRFGVEGAAAFEDQVAAEGGTLVAAISLLGGEAGYPDEVDQFNAACGADGEDCDVVYLVLEPTTATPWINSGATFGGLWTMAPPTLFSEAFAEQCVAERAAFGEDCPLITWTGFNPPIGALASLPDVADYVASVRAVDSAVDVVNPFTEGAYAGTKVFLEALTQAGPNLDREALRTVLDGMTFTSDLSTPLSWSPGNHRANVAMRAFEVLQGGSSFMGWRDASGGWVLDPRPGAS